MTERKKFDDDMAAKVKIATSPDITSGMKEHAERVEEHVAQPVGTSSEHVKTVPDDPETDRRNTRILCKAAERAGAFDEDTQAALQEFGDDLWPLLRLLGMGHRLYAGIMIFLISAPALMSGAKVMTNFFKKKEGEDDAE